MLDISVATKLFPFGRTEIMEQYKNVDAFV